MKSDIEALGKLNNKTGEEYFRDNIIEVKYDLKHSPDALVTVVFQTSEINKLDKFKDISGGMYTFPISNVEKIPHGKRNFKNYRREAWAITQWDRRQKKETTLPNSRDRSDKPVTKFSMMDIVNK